MVRKKPCLAHELYVWCAVLVPFLCSHKWDTDSACNRKAGCWPELPSAPSQIAEDILHVQHQQLINAHSLFTHSAHSTLECKEQKGWLTHILTVMTEDCRYKSPNSCTTPKHTVITCHHLNQGEQTHLLIVVFWGLGENKQMLGETGRDKNHKVDIAHQILSTEAPLLPY